MTVTEPAVRESATGALPDLHSQQPAVAMVVNSVGHRGVKRPLLVDGEPAMAVIDVSVGLQPTQRGAHMSRLVDCLGTGNDGPLRDYVRGCLDRLRAATPDAASWSLDVRATRLLEVDNGVKPVEEVCSVHQQQPNAATMTWGVALKVCLACPQAQAGIAHDRLDEQVGMHPSHNQVCDLTITLTGGLDLAAAASLTDLVALGEASASGRVRERYKRREEADCVTEVHHNAKFAEDALRGLAHQLRSLYPDAASVTCDIVNYESIFEYPLHCVVTA